MNTAVLREAVEGFYRDYADSQLPQGLGLAPASNMRSVKGEFLVAASDNRYDARVDLGPAGFDAEYTRGDMSLGTVNVDIKRYPASYQILPYRLIDSTAQSVDLIQVAVNSQLDQIYGQYVRNLNTVATSLDAGTALDLSGQTEDVAGKLKADIRAIQKATNKRPNVIYMGPEAADRFLLQDAVFAGGALAAAASPTVERRTGATDEEALRAWFRRVLGLELLIEERSGIDTSGDSEFILSTQAVLAHAAPGVGASCFKTFHNGADLATFDVAETVAPQAKGVIITCDAYYDLKIVDPNLGLKIALTLS